MHEDKEAGQLQGRIRHIPGAVLLGCVCASTGQSLRTKNQQYAIAFCIAQAVLADTGRDLIPGKCVQDASLKQSAEAAEVLQLQEKAAIASQEPLEPPISTLMAAGLRWRGLAAASRGPAWPGAKARARKSSAGASWNQSMARAPAPQDASGLVLIRFPLPLETFCDHTGDAGLFRTPGLWMHHNI